MLTPKKEKLLKAMGKSRAQSHTVRTVMSDQFDGVKLDHNLMHRVMRKGRVEAWGGDEHESNLIFYAEGIKLKDHDSRYGVSGKFATTHCSQTPTLLSWMEQTPIEVLNVRVYGGDSFWVDSTHNGTKYTLKTGPVSVCDWGGLVAPAGIFQVPEEEIEILTGVLIDMELNTPKGTMCTDGGPAWQTVAKVFDKNQVEDTFHNDKNGDKKAAALKRDDKRKFKDMKYKLLYGVFQPEEELDTHIQNMKNLVQGDKELKNWVDRMDRGKEIRTATHHYCRRSHSHCCRHSYCRCSRCAKESFCTIH